MISIIVPTLNESENIPKFLKNLIKIRFKYELIFVDDNSWDNTQNIIKKIKNKRIKFILRKDKIRDLSKSVMLGIENSKYNYVLVLDCDLQHDIKNANKMVNTLLKKNLDLVIGSRFLKTKYSGNLGFFRSLFSVFFIILINFLFKKKTSDPLSGFFLCKKSLILKNKKNYFLQGYKILFDILYNSDQKLNLSDINIIFQKIILGASKLNKRIVVNFIKQLIYTISR